MDDYVELEDHFALCVKATELLRQINDNARRMRWQGLGAYNDYRNLEAEINDAHDGWLSSNC